MWVNIVSVVAEMASVESTALGADAAAFDPRVLPTKVFWGLEGPQDMGNHSDVHPARGKGVLGPGSGGIEASRGIQDSVRASSGSASTVLLLMDFLRLPFHSNLDIYRLHMLVVVVRLDSFEFSFC